MLLREAKEILKKKGYKLKKPTFEEFYNKPKIKKLVKLAQEAKKEALEETEGDLEAYDSFWNDIIDDDFADDLNKGLLQTFKKDFMWVGYHNCYLYIQNGTEEDGGFYGDWDDVQGLRFYLPGGEFEDTDYIKNIKQFFKIIFNYVSKGYGIASARLKFTLNEE